MQLEGCTDRSVGERYFHNLMVDSSTLKVPKFHRSQIETIFISKISNPLFRQVDLRFLSGTFISRLTRLFQRQIKLLKMTLKFPILIYLSFPFVKFMFHQFEHFSRLYSKSKMRIIFLLTVLRNIFTAAQDDYPRQSSRLERLQSA